ncbi:MAG: metallophosphoesterase family protein [Candidatus Aenigmarchaeota archaeon]|nr:metallophosphoesterase family protein [Candidatus Aenigmarchaeota archaeon]
MPKKKSKFRMLVAGDLHGNKQTVKRLVEKAEKYNVDLVVITGDFSVFDIDHKGMVGPFLEKGKKVVFVGGNHDSPATIEEIEKEYRIPNLQKYAIVTDDIGFFGAGGGNIGINYVPDKEMFNSIRNGFRYVQKAKTKVLVTHIHPKGSLIEKFSFPGSEAVTKAIYELKPDMHICGHIHELEGAVEVMGNTKVMCVGSSGKIVDID